MSQYFFSEVATDVAVFTKFQKKFILKTLDSKLQCSLNFIFIACVWLYAMSSSTINSLRVSVARKVMDLTGIIPTL